MLRIRFRKEDHKDFNLWLPLFLICFIALPLLIALLPLVLLAALILWPSGKGKLILYGYFMIFVLIGYMPGLKIDILQTNY